MGPPSPPPLDLNPQVEFSLLNPNGPFVLLNPISKLPAGETHVLALAFCPRESVMVSPRPTLRHAAAWASTVHSPRCRPRPPCAHIVPALCSGLQLTAGPWEHEVRPLGGTQQCLLHAEGHGLHRPKKHWTS